MLGRGGDQVVNVLACYSDDPSSNPADTFSLFCKICDQFKKQCWAVVILMIQNDSHLLMNIFCHIDEQNILVTVMKCD